MHCAPALLMLKQIWVQRLPVDRSCFGCGFFLAGLSSRNYWEPQYLTHLQVGGKFFSTVTLLYYLCFAPNVLTAGVVLCCRVTSTFCLHLHFRGCWLLHFRGCSLLWLALVRLHLSTRSLSTSSLGLHNAHIKWLNVWCMEYSGSDINSLE